MKTSRLIAALIVLGAASLAHAEPICPASSSSSDQEGNLPLSEDSFNESTAREALIKLEALFGPEGTEADAVAWQTSFVYLEGWYLKRQAQVAIKRGEPEPFVSDFCAFLRDRAYVRH